MPNRILHEKMTESPTLDQVSDRAERLATRLIVKADDYGRFDADPRVLLAKCFPLKVNEWTAEDIGARRDELARAGYLGLYRVGERLYGHLIAWFQHQRRRSSRPKYPGPDDPKAVPVEVPAAPCGELPQVAADGGKSRQVAAHARVSRAGSREKGEGSTTLQPPQKPAAAAGKAPTPGAEAFEAYAEAYRARYGVPPVRNHRVNSMFKRLAELLGAEAPAVAAFYVSHPGLLYVRSKHAVQPLVDHAEGLRTEWATGRTVTDAEARQGDRAAAPAQIMTPGNAGVARRFLERHGEAPA